MDFGHDRRTYTHNVPDRRLARMLERAAQCVGALTAGPMRCADGSYDVFMVLQNATRDEVLTEFDRRHRLAVFRVNMKAGRDAALRRQEASDDVA